MRLRCTEKHSSALFRNWSATVQRLLSEPSGAMLATEEFFRTSFIFRIFSETHWGSRCAELIWLAALLWLAELEIRGCLGPDWRLVFDSNPRCFRTAPTSSSCAFQSECLKCSNGLWVLRSVRPITSARELRVRQAHTVLGPFASCKSNAPNWPQREREMQEIPLVHGKNAGVAAEKLPLQYLKYCKPSCRRLYRVLLPGEAFSRCTGMASVAVGFSRCSSGALLSLQPKN